MILISRLSCRIWRTCHLLSCARSICGKISSKAVKSCDYVQLGNIQMFHSQFVSLNGCKLLTVADESEISRRLLELQTADELLNFISDADSEVWTPELSSLLTERLVSTHYQSLRAVYPWLHESVIVASKQLRLGDSLVLQDAAAPVHVHLAYETWMNIVEHTCSRYNPDQLARALQSALHLFVDVSSSLVHRLLSETHQRLPYFGFSALCALSNSLKALPGNNYVLVRLLLKQMQTLLASVESPSDTELTSIATVYSDLRHLLNTSFRSELVAELVQMIQRNKEVLLSPVCVDAYFHIGHLLYFKSAYIHQSLLDIIVETCQEYGDQLDISDVCQMCTLLHTGRKGYYILRHAFNILQSRALHLLSDDSRLSEVIDLMHCLTKHSSSEVILQFYNALHSRLICSDYVDIFSLSSIARILYRMPSVNVDLLTLVQHFIVHQVDTIVQHPSIFSFIETFLSHHCFVDKDLERQFNDRLLSYVRRRDGLSTKYATSVVSAYLLPVINDGLPAPVFKHVITAVDQWREGQLLKQSARFNSAQSLLLSNRQSCQLNKLNSAMYQNLCKQLDSVDSLESMHMLAGSLLRYKCKRHPVVIDSMMNIYQQYSSSLSDNLSAWRIASILYKLGYYLPEVYDDLVHYIVNTDNVGIENLV